MPPSLAPDASHLPTPTNNNGKAIEDDNVENDDDRAILNLINAPVVRTLNPSDPVKYIKDMFMWLLSGITKLFLATKVHLITSGDFSGPWEEFYVKQFYSDTMIHVIFNELTHRLTILFL